MDEPDVDTRIETYCHRTMWWENAIDVRADEAGELDLVFPVFDRSPRCELCEGASQNIEDNDYMEKHSVLASEAIGIPPVWGNPVRRWERRMRSNATLHFWWIDELRELSLTRPDFARAAERAQFLLAEALRKND